jgi:hypothetical protein
MSRPRLSPTTCISTVSRSILSTSPSAVRPSGNSIVTTSPMRASMTFSTKTSGPWMLRIVE